MTAVLTRQSNGIKSKVAHHPLGGTAIACRPRGVKSTLVPVDRPVDCSRCIARLGGGAPPSPQPPRQPAPTPPGVGAFDPGPDDDLDWPEPEPKYELRPGDSPKSPYTVAARPGARSMTLGEVLWMIQENKLIVDATKPIRACGRFDSDSTLGVMISEDGALVVMSVD